MFSFKEKFLAATRTAGAAGLTAATVLEAILNIFR
jgi:hypothetical protein